MALENILIFILLITVIMPQLIQDKSLGTDASFLRGSGDEPSVFEASFYMRAYTAERWASFYKFGEMFLVSNMGRVKKSGGVFLFKRKSQKGYAVVNLCVRGQRKEEKVHRLVAKCFVANPENKPFVNHIDGVKDNNIHTNLEWCTTWENVIHAVENGLLKSGQRSKKATITDETALNIFNDYGSNKELSVKYNTTSNIVGSIKSGRAWSIITGFYNPLRRLTPVKKKKKQPKERLIRKTPPEFHVIIGYPNYAVNKLGEIFSLTINKLLTPQTTWNGYKYVRLFNNKKYKKYRVHRIVAEAFIPNPSKKLFVNHKNGIKTDNRLENLEWNTKSENGFHYYKLKKEIPKEASGGL